MTNQEYEAVVLAQTCWKLSLSSSIDELIAIGCTIRNHIIPRPGRIVTYRTWLDACEDFTKVYPIRPLPISDADSFFLPPNGLISICQELYDCSYPDLTATQTTPGALYFARAAQVSPSDWRHSIIQTRQLLGTFGSQQFFA
jgi:hypothetical protein